MICPPRLPRLSALLLVSVMILSSRVGRADSREDAVVARLVQMNRRALDDYDSLEWKSAKRRLLEAIAEAKKARIEKHPIVARTYLHLGAVFITGFRDREAGVQSFIHALEIDPQIRVATAMETAAITRAFADAQAKAKTSGGSGGGERDQKETAEGDEAPAKSESGRSKDDGEPDLPMHINALDCPNADEAVREKPFTVRCAVAPTLKVTGTVLFFRKPGQPDFTSVKMKKSAKGWYVGKIPKDVTDGKSVQFYVEGNDRAGKAIVANGRNGSPNLMLVRDDDDAEADAETPTEHEENPLEGPQEKKPRVVIRKVPGVPDSAPDPRFGRRRWWIGLGFGSGFGYAKGDGLEVRTDLQSKFGPGLSWAGLGHLTPEIGVHLGRTLALALQGRNQFIPQSGPTAKNYYTGAHAALLRLMAFTAPRRLRLYGVAMAGYGVFRILILNTDPANPGAKDTVKGGPILLGLGAGVSYQIVKSASLILEVNGLGGYPVFSVVGDLNAGFQVNF